MRIEDLDVALRPRSPWEALELGSALVRRHAAAIWRPWLGLSVPVWIVLNLLCWRIDAIWLAAVLMWWLKPAFDRIPLFVLSRAVFGQVPTARETLRAQWSWGLRWLPAYLTWRRLGPVRSLYQPVDLLEGGAGEDARARRRALGSPVYGIGAVATLVFAHFELALVLGVGFLVLLFSPAELVKETAARAWNVLESQPDWLQFTSNGVAWFATSLLEPFYVGAGFGLYLNRRTEIEAWDIELVLRRLGARLAQAARPLLLLALLGGSLWLPVRAQDEPEPPRSEIQAQAGDGEESRELREIFGKELVDDEGWRQAVKRAYEDPRVDPTRPATRWVPRKPDEPRPPPKDSFGKFGQLLASIGEYGLWIVAGVVVLILLLTAPRWTHWLREAGGGSVKAPPQPRREAHEEPESLPEDVIAQARRLWQAGRERDALALVYRGCVVAMAERAQVVLIPGATEAHTLRASRQLPSADDRDAFAQIVRVWQVAAYAHGLPTGEEFEALLLRLSQRFFAARAEALA